jgi:hypothetical protein
MDETKRKKLYVNDMRLMEVSDKHHTPASLPPAKNPDTH